MSNPFRSQTSKPGHGVVHLALLPPCTPRLTTTSYQYPLKLVAPAAVKTESEPAYLVHTIYVLSYGGGLVAGDSIDLHVTLDSSTRLVLLTQGSTKLFKAPSREVLSKQHMTVNLAPGSALCYLPDPVQPFKNSCFEQRQTYNVAVPAEEGPPGASLCVLDWVCNGRPANGENWSFTHYGSRNEIYLCQPNGTRKLLLRDCILLDDEQSRTTLASRMHDVAVFGTLVLYGPLCQSLGAFFMNEFKALPRVGGRKWDSGSESGEEDHDPAAAWRAARQGQESTDGLLWSAASVRGCVVVKFGAREVEGGRRWLRAMLVEEGSTAREFGERALLCLR